jgi:membrane protease YdiL (CAAX protease family)
VPTFADDVILLVIVAYPVWEYFVSWPRAKARLASGEPDARWKLYRTAIATQWVATAGIGTLWFILGRPAARLYLQVPTGWRLVLSIVLVVGITLPMAAQLVSVLRISAEQRVALRPKLGYARSIVPHTAAEYRWFLPLAVTAGLCEELIYRGYLTWLLASYVGLWVGAAVSVVMFGVAHGYLGKTGVVRATLLGAIFAGFVIALRSLYPIMLVHAIVDLGSGMLGYVLLREPVGHAS